MSLSATAPSLDPNRAALPALLGKGAIFVGVLLSGFVIDEPAPYELYMAGLIAVWALFGLRISMTAAILLSLFVLFIFGGLISVTQLSDDQGAALYMAVSMFLALTSVFLTAVLEKRPQLYQTIFTAWIVAAIPASLLGVAGYFGFGGETFVKFGRAAGTFQDPNVFGPFLAVPAVYLLYRIYTGSPARLPLYLAALLILAAGIFFSFSRGAWGVLAFSAMLMTFVLLIQPSRATVKLRIAIFSILAIAFIALAVIAALQLPGVAELFAQRAHLEQSYDAGPFGRFGRHAIGLEMAMAHPLGIGPMLFGKIFGEDTHNIWLKALLDYGWLGFAAYVTIVIMTLAGGFRILLRNRPWQPYLLCAYVTFVAHVALGNIIDTDHWRHFYLLVGMIWGAMALEQRHQAQQMSVKPAAGAMQPAG